MLSPVSISRAPAHTRLENLSGTMSDLYPELWLVIFNALDNAPGKKQDLLSVCQASQLFLQLAEPLLFANILLINGHLSSALISVLRARVETRHWVQSIEINTKRVYEGADSIAQSIRNIFVQLHNLRNIRIIHTWLTDDMVYHLYHLQHPFTFSCWNLYCSDETAKLDLDPRTLTIRELILDELREPNAAALVTRLALGPHLSLLHLSRTASLAIFQIPSGNVNHSFEKLQDLAVSQPIDAIAMKQFLDFLALCPRLSNLKIYTRRNAVARGPFTLPPTSIPLLSSFNGPYALATLFVRQRPLHAIEVELHDTYRNLGRELMSELAKGATPLRDLDISEILWHDSVLLDIADYFPRLQCLKLSITGEVYLTFVLDRFMSDVQRLPQLQSLIILSEYSDMHSAEDLELEHQALESLGVSNDSLTVVRFRHTTFWSRKGGKWENHTTV
ncbi:hypothetical protein FRB97_007293 [Tulasnella sp. 331]|nr:hypothetical protein FRB97_007293 [Tulasnella sp. 331]